MTMARKIAIAFGLVFFVLILLRLGFRPVPHAKLERHDERPAETSRSEVGTEQRGTGSTDGINLAAFPNVYDQLVASGTFSKHLPALRRQMGDLTRQMRKSESEGKSALDALDQLLPSPARPFWDATENAERARAFQVFSYYVETKESETVDLRLYLDLLDAIHATALRWPALTSQAAIVMAGTLGGFADEAGIGILSADVMEKVMKRDPSEHIWENNPYRRRIAAKLAALEAEKQKTPP